MAGELIQPRLDPDFSLMPWLLPAHVRDEVRVFGRFVRLAEGVAANPMLSRSARHARLATLEAMLDPGPGGGEADRAVMTALRESLLRRGISSGHARRILHALDRTVTGTGAKPSDPSGSSRPARDVVHATWAEVVAGATGIAAPIGRHMLALLGEDADRCGRPTDALCTALRILKAIRDGNIDGEAGAALCIPAAFLQDASISLRHLSAPSARGQTRAVLDRVLDGADALLLEAEILPLVIENRRLRTYVRVVLCRAHKLSARCRLGDPLRERIGLSGWERQTCVWLNLLRDFVRS
ncbi:MAG: squalene/phytoene synthase family protein [Rhodospirillales bacterium]|nr:squalene/phytoene synthase family protein [Rhodospirillales bacterium]